MYDVLYPVKPWGRNTELRYSLRSLVNLPIGNVYMGGFTPEWVTNVISVDREQTGDKFANHHGNVRLMLERMIEDGSTQALMFNDDHYIMHKRDSMPVYHRGTIKSRLDRAIAENVDGLIQQYEITYDISKRFGKNPEPLAYDLHRPFPFEPKKLLEVFDLVESEYPGAKRFWWNSIYGNIHGLEAIEDRDVKIRFASIMEDPDRDNYPFLSSEDSTFNQVLRPYLKTIFDKPCVYENY